MKLNNNYHIHLITLFIIYLIDHIDNCLYAVTTINFNIHICVD